VTARTNPYAITHPEFLHVKRGPQRKRRPKPYDVLEASPDWYSAPEAFEKVYGRPPDRKEAQKCYAQLRSRFYRTQRLGSYVRFFIAPPGTPATPLLR
jgi:hypothetical protein